MTLLFDLDGTLIDTYALYREAYERALRSVMDEPPPFEELLSLKPSSERFFLREMLSAEQTALCHDQMCAEYETLYPSYAAGRYEGVAEMLAGLRSAGIPIGIVTGKGRRAWEITERFEALGPFDAIVTEDDVAAPKPDPEGLATALRLMDGDPRESAYIGDSVVDLEAGRAAGMRIGIALWAKEAPGEAEAFLTECATLEPDWAFCHPSDVTRAFARWC